MPPKKKEDAPKILLGRPKGTLKMGLVGLPNVGKSTTFNVITKQAVPAENFPFCTIDPSEARMSVPDDRFNWLCQHYKPASEVPPTLTVFDIAGLVRGAHEGEGLGNAFLSHIQAVDGIYHVVRAFEDSDIVHTEGEVDPVRDLQTIADELRFKDIERCEKMVAELERQYGRGQDKSKKTEFEFMQTVLDHLKSGKWIASADKAWTAKEADMLNERTFLTAKPVVYLVNLSINDYARQKNKWLAKIAAWVKENHPGPIIPFSAEFERDLGDQGDDAAKMEYSEKVGVKGGSALPKIITTGYAALNLIHYFTGGADEVKCWTIRSGTKAPQAAGIIHSDMENGFICAEITKFQDLVDAGNDAAVKANGKLQLKGKDYVIEDGDIVFYKFNPSGGGSGKKK